MRKYGIPAALCVFTLLTFLVPGCGSAGRGDHGELYPPVPMTMVLPYVEAVHFPSEIHAGRWFTVHLDLSCEQFPDALRSPARPFLNLDQTYVGGEPGYYERVGVVLYRDPAQIDTTGPVHSTVSFDVMGLKAGQHKLDYIAARTRSEGGMQIQVDKGSFIWLYRDPVPFFQQVPFTVLP
jgi:hypothetical protein